MGDVVNGGGWWGDDGSGPGFGVAPFSCARPPDIAGRRRFGEPTVALATAGDTGYGRFAPGLSRVVV
jgi:hypothetical protein